MVCVSTWHKHGRSKTKPTCTNERYSWFKSFVNTTTPSCSRFMIVNINVVIQYLFHVDNVYIYTRCARGLQCKQCVNQVHVLGVRSTSFLHSFMYNGVEGEGQIYACSRTLVNNKLNITYRSIKGFVLGSIQNRYTVYVNNQCFRSGNSYSHLNGGLHLYCRQALHFARSTVYNSLLLE